MAPQNAANRPFNPDLEPLLQVDSTVELQPLGEVYSVYTLEVMPTIETQEFTVEAGSSLNRQEIRSMYGQGEVLVQARLPDPVGEETAIPEDVVVTVDQGGEESPRFNIKNQRGYLDADTPTYGDAYQQTELYQWEDTDLFFNIENRGEEDVTFSMKFTGWAYDVRGEPDMNPQDADATVLVERKSLRGR